MIHLRSVAQIHPLDISAGSRPASRSTRRAFRVPTYVHVSLSIVLYTQQKTNTSRIRKNLSNFLAVLTTILLRNLNPARSTWSAASFGRCCASLTEERTDGRSELVVRTHHCTPPFFFFILVNDGERVRPTPAASVRISRVVWGWRRGQSLKISV